MKGEFYMAAKSANLYARIEPHRGLPFELKIPNSMPVDINTLSEEEFNNELEIMNWKRDMRICKPDERKM